LLSQVRGAVVEDQRGGGLQMMSQGDPSLLLNYCREYWDGSSITPLSSNDRKEVLSVYNRWDLEDFDVVAFAYTPVPGHLQPSIVNTYGNSKINSNFNKKSSKIALNQINLINQGNPEKEKEKSNCIFIIDPRTYQEVEQITATTKATPNKPQLSPISIDDVSNTSRRGFHSDKAVSDTDIAISDIEIGLNYDIDKKDFISSDTDVLSYDSASNKINEVNNLVDGSNDKSDDAGVHDSDGNYNNHILDDIDDEIITDNDQPSADQEVFGEYIDENDEDNKRNKNSNNINELNSQLTHNLDEENGDIFVEIGSGLEFDIERIPSRDGPGLGFEIERIPSYATSVGTVETDLTESAFSLNDVDCNNDLNDINDTSFKKSYSVDDVFTSSSLINKSSKRFINSKTQAFSDSDNSTSIHADVVLDIKANGTSELNHRTKNMKTSTFDKDMSNIISSKHKHLINNNRKTKLKSASHSLGSSLWSLMRQQVFLGMAASSVPIKPEVIFI
jgi:hypothetical protein